MRLVFRSRRLLPEMHLNLLSYLAVCFTTIGAVCAGEMPGTVSSTFYQQEIETTEAQFCVRVVTPQPIVSGRGEELI